MKSVQAADWGKPFVVSLIINIIFGLVIFGSISLMKFQYFDNFWTNWVLFVSCLAIAFIAWKELDPFKGNWKINGWITRFAGLAVLLVLAFTIGF